MRLLKKIPGTIINQGTAYGALKVFTKPAKGEKNKQKPYAFENSNESLKLKEAILLTQEKLLKAQHEAKEKTAHDILEARYALFEDGFKNSWIEKAINLTELEGVNAEYALTVTAEETIATLKNVEDDYIKSRCEDIKSITDTIIENLYKNVTELTPLMKPSIVAAENLLVEDLVLLDTKKIIGVITNNSSPLSHTAIFVKSLSIPFLTGIDVNRLKSDRNVLLDCIEGNINLSPLECEIKAFNKITLAARENYAKGLKIYANAGSLKEIKKAKELNYEGIGLLRTEFLYIKNNKLPTEEEQFSFYKEALEIMKEKPVIIRTADLGGDKMPAYLNLIKEENPALGIRGIRFSLKYKDIFITQIRALLKASQYGNLKIIFPMVSREEEFIKAKEIIESVKEELIKSGNKIKNPQIGVMIETPAAAILSDKLSKQADFLSIGTNDLTQFTEAADRNNADLSDCLSETEAVSRLVINTIENAKRSRIQAGICGVLSENKEFIEGLGNNAPDYISVSLD